MADSKISALPAATTPVAGTETLPIVQGGVTKQVSIANLTAGRAVSMLSATAGNIQISGNTIASTDTNGNINLTPNGTGVTAIGNYATFGTGSGFTSVKLQSSAASGADLVFTTGTSQRWILEKAGAESGSNAGSDLYLYRYDDSGAYLGLSLLIKRSTGDVTAYSNIIQGTAAKGINFTANSAAAGMTSQLLNWYEEGTWTPNQGAGLTLVGAFSSSGTYTRIGRQVTVRGQVAGATSIAVAAAGTISSNLPFTAAVSHAGSMFNAAVNASGVVQITSASVVAADAIAATANITFTATYTV